jgi:hypothetical protein
MQSKERNAESSARETKEQQASNERYLPEMRNKDV